MERRVLRALLLDTFQLTADWPSGDCAIRLISTLEARERKVRDQQGVEYSLRVRPYRTADNKIDGAVIMLVDIDGRNVQNTSKRSSRTKQVSARQ